MEKLIDRFGRRIDTLRISVTDKCNFKCLYCYSDKIVFSNKDDLLTYEEIVYLVKIFSDLGIKKIKITGGEPFLRKDLVFLLHQLSNFSYLEDLSLTTNGYLLYDFISEIKKTRFKRINISLDTLKKEKFKFITGNDSFDKVIKSIEKSVSEGLKIKINVVLLRGINDDEVFDFIKFGEFYDIIVRFIELMPSSHQRKELWENYFISSDEIIEKIKKEIGLIKYIEKENVFSPNTTYFKINGYKGIYGIISPLSKPFCSLCNRLRLTSDGVLFLCLSSLKGLDLKTVVRRNNKYAIKEKIRNFVFKEKPRKHCFSNKKIRFSMCKIGG
jgi:cyclic pyranopterin phosphate synthase